MRRVANGELGQLVSSMNLFGLYYGKNTCNGLIGIVTDKKGRQGVVATSNVGGWYTAECGCIGGGARGYTYSSILSL